MRFKSREHAAGLLAQRLKSSYKSKNPLVLGVPRGAVPMAKIIAEALDGELDIVPAHKLTHPEQPELAIGAIDEAGQCLRQRLGGGIKIPFILRRRKSASSLCCVERRVRYTPWRKPIDPHDRIVIVVDDGIATGSTITAALRVLRAHKPIKLVGAVGVASPEAAQAMRHECDAMVCLNVPADFFSVGRFFDDFSPVTDDDVVTILKQNVEGVSAAG